MVTRPRAALLWRSGVGDFADDFEGAGFVSWQDADGERCGGLIDGLVCAAIGIGVGFVGFGSVDIAVDSDLGEARAQDFGHHFVVARPDFGRGVFEMKFVGEGFVADVVGAFVALVRQLVYILWAATFTVIGSRLVLSSVGV